MIMPLQRKVVRRINSTNIVLIKDTDIVFIGNFEQCLASSYNQHLQNIRFIKRYKIE